MKIGILTYHAVSNFGAQLQVLSTVSYLKKNGYEPIVVNWYPSDLEQYYIKCIPQEQIKMHNEFVNKYLPVTKLCRTEEDIVTVLSEKQIEGLIIGSDAVLGYQTFRSRLKIRKSGIRLAKKLANRSYPNPFWGNFLLHLKPMPAVLMSVSSQNAEYRQIHTSLRNKMGVSLNFFNYISVRDDWTQVMVRYLTRGKIFPKVTPDPVFGFNNNIITQIPPQSDILAKYNLPEKYILLSFKDDGTGVVSEKWIDRFEELAKESDCATVALCMPEGIGFKNNLKYNIDVPLCPLHWYALIKYSQGYIGHNMHPIIVSLHNAIPFFSFDNYGIVQFKYFVNSRSSKIFHILKEAGFQEYRCSALGKLGYKEPAPKMVLDHILNFDKEACREFSDKYFERYIKMMKEIEKVLKA